MKREKKKNPRLKYVTFIFQLNINYKFSNIFKLLFNRVLRYIPVVSLFRCANSSICPSFKELFFFGIPFPLKFLQWYNYFSSELIFNGHIHTHALSQRLIKSSSHFWVTCSKQLSLKLNDSVNFLIYECESKPIGISFQLKSDD